MIAGMRKLDEGSWEYKGREIFLQDRNRGAYNPYKVSLGPSFQTLKEAARYIDEQEAKREGKSLGQTCSKCGCDLPNQGQKSGNVGAGLAFGSGPGWFGFVNGHTLLDTDQRGPKVFKTEQEALEAAQRVHQKNPTYGFGRYTR